MKKIVIVGVDSFENRGVEALVRSIVQGLQASFGQPEIDIFCTGFSFNQSSGPEAFCSFYDDPYRSFSAKALRKIGLLFTIIPEVLNKEFRNARKTIRHADLVISTGGDIFGKDYGGFQNYLTPLIEARQASTPYVFLGHSIGPFEDEALRKMFKDIVASATLVTCRETRSLEYVIDNLGLPSDRVALVGDVAFLLRPASRKCADEILSEIGIAPDEPRIAVSVSGGISQFSGLDKDQHACRWAETLTVLAEQTGLRVIVIPHVWSGSPDPSNNDMIEAKKVLSHLNHSRVSLIERQCSAMEYKAIIGTCEFLVAERMHAAIAGLSQHVPTVAISYSVKADGIIGDLFINEPESRKPILSISDYMKGPDSDIRLLEYFNRRADLRAMLGENVPRMTKLAQTNFDLLEKIL
ncbi:MAG: hypothetical protein GKS00_06740 [Alphaproteobacteria bacterium]|nr:hypothetical protein [Alphaproteobacteria bacterium]